MEQLIIDKSEFDFLLNTFTGWNGRLNKLKVIKKSDFNLNDFPNHNDLMEENQLASQYEEMTKNCQDDEMVAYEYREATKQEIKDFLDEEINFFLDRGCTILEDAKEDECQEDCLECPMCNLLFLSNIID